MGAAQILLARAHAYHKELWSEDATFRGETVSARINRLGTAPNARLSGQVDITSPAGSTILLDRTLSRPLQDEIISEGDQQHRIIENATDLGYAWLCKCDISID